MINANFYELGQILGGYLHQDWGDEFESDRAALSEAVKSEPAQNIAAAISQIEFLLGAPLTERELGEFLIRPLGCYFDPSAKGMTYRQWLADVHDALQN